MSPFQLKFESLPSTLPIFPLPQAIVLPGSQPPLNIFEERYLSMIFDALGETIRYTQDLWPWVLFFVALLLLLDIYLKRLRLFGYRTIKF